MSKSTEDSQSPRAIIHKKILDVAESNPEESVEGLAAQTTGASPALVERVLDQYGDPAAEATATDDSDEWDDIADQSAVVAESTAETMDSTDEGESSPEVIDETDESEASVETADTEGAEQSAETTEEDLSDRQLQTLRTVYEHPDTSQQDIGELLGISGPAVSQRLTDIEGFSWTNRDEFTKRLFDDTAEDSATVDTVSEQSEESVSEQTDGSETSETAPEDETTPQPEETMTTQNTEIDASLDERVASLEAQFEDRTVFDDPELVHKVVHACMNSDAISEEEELQILQQLLG